MTALTSQRSRVRALSADERRTARSMRRSAAATRRLAVRAARQPHGLLAGAAIAGSALWLAQQRDTEAMLRALGKAFELGTIIWRIASADAGARAAGGRPDILTEQDRSPGA